MNTQGSVVYNVASCQHGLDMFYTPFLLLQSQLLDQRKAKIIIEGVEVFFQALPEHDKWVLKAKIFIPLESLTQALEEELTSLDEVQTGKGVLIKTIPDEGVVTISYIAKASSSFLQFKALIHDFMSSYDLWKSVTDDMIKNEGLLLT